MLLQHVGRAGRQCSDMTQDIYFYFIDPGDLEGILTLVIRLVNDKPARMPEGYGWIYVYNPLVVHQAVASLQICSDCPFGERRSCSTAVIRVLSVKDQFDRIAAIFILLLIAHGCEIGKTHAVAICSNP